MESDKIQALQLIYKSRLTEKAAQLQVFISLLTGSFDSLEQRLSIEQEAGEYLHRLVGSAGMYGYDDIAESAKQAMHLSAKQGNQELSSALIQLHDLLEQHS